MLLPWVVRDPECRKNERKGRPEDWGSPNADGYFRDDNSMIKGLVGAMSARGPKQSFMNGLRLGKGWVASHIWRFSTDGQLTNTHPLLNSFVPNIVWLPRQIAKLSDREGGPLQLMLQQMSRTIFEEAPVDQRVAPIVQNAWSKLPSTRANLAVDPDSLTWFSTTEDFLFKRKQATQRVIDAIRSIERGDVIGRWHPICHRYPEGLNGFRGRDMERLSFLARELEPHALDGDSG